MPAHDRAMWAWAELGNHTELQSQAEELLTGRALPGRAQVMQSAAGGTAEEWW